MLLIKNRHFAIPGKRLLNRQLLYKFKRSADGKESADRYVGWNYRQPLTIFHTLPTLNIHIPRSEI
jgi:hypothetical protein